MIKAEVVLKALETFVYQIVVQHHGEKVALVSATALFDCLWLNFRKQRLYVPTLDRIALQQRNATIWREFNGSNHDELAIKHRLSVMQIYSITKKIREQHAGAERKERSAKDAQDKPLAIWVIEEYLPVEWIKCGLTREEATALAHKVAAYLCQNFPGVSVCVSDALKKTRSRIAVATIQKPDLSH